MAEKVGFVSGSFGQRLDMTTVLLFHHAQGRTEGLLDFAERLERAGHTIHAPDLYDGKTFETLDDGIAYAKEMGFGEFLRRGTEAAEDVPPESVFGGFSLGVMPAQWLAQTRSGAKGALLYHACFPTEEFGGPWPASVPAQIHMMENDPLGEEDLQAAEALALSVDGVELFVYPGRVHLFADNGLSDYDEEAARLLTERTLAFLDGVQ
jgi:dienelactone hydrolase